MPGAPSGDALAPSSVLVQETEDRTIEVGLLDCANDLGVRQTSEDLQQRSQGNHVAQQCFTAGYPLWTLEAGSRLSRASPALAESQEQGEKLGAQY